VLELEVADRFPRAVPAAGRPVSGDDDLGAEVAMSEAMPRTWPSDLVAAVGTRTAQGVTMGGCRTLLNMAGN